ncbi:MAG: hypothetical protein ACXVJB_00285 [Mucilaginibacter sp.]
MDRTNAKAFMGFKQWMAMLLRPKWMGTPEMFLAVVMEMSLRNNPDYSTRELLQLGEVMQKMVRINLKPYKNFADLLERGIPDESIVENLKKNEMEVHQRRDLKQAIYGPDADLGDDDVLKSDSEGARFARKMVKNMSAYVEFPEEEQRKIDDFDKL